MDELNWPRATGSGKLSEQAWANLRSRKDLGYLRLPDNDGNWTASAAFAKKLSKFKKLKVLGMGGSGLGGRMLIEAFSKKRDAVQFFSDSHPQPFVEALKTLDRSTAWLVVSKSGTTLETLSQLMALSQTLKSKKLQLKNHVFVITEPKESPLKNWVTANGIICVDHPLDVGGRFSVLSPVGLVPAQWAGVDIKKLRAGAKNALARVDDLIGFSERMLESFERRESVSVLWSYSYQLHSFIPWLQQLWAESLGKTEDGPASTPLPSYGTGDQHSVLQQYMEGRKDKHVIIFREASVRSLGTKVKSKGFDGFDYIDGKTLGEIYLAESLATEQALLKYNRSVSVISFNKLSLEVLGELIMGMEIVIGLLGAALKIDAFNQPGVELGKKIAKQLLKEGF